MQVNLHQVQSELKSLSYQFETQIVSQEHKKYNLIVTFNEKYIGTDTPIKLIFDFTNNLLTQISDNAVYSIITKICHHDQKLDNTHQNKIDQYNQKYLNLLLFNMALDNNLVFTTNNSLEPKNLNLNTIDDLISIIGYYQDFYRDLARFISNNQRR